MKLNQLVITESDFDRLNELVHTPGHRATHAPVLRSLGRELNRGVVIPSTGMPRFIVTMNTRVRVRDLQSREIEEFTLCYPADADMGADRVSVLTPMGMAILGARVLETLEFSAPGGTKRLKLEEIVYQPEAQGHYHL
jgi:regulator of nucleoside diphosphate kinase